MPPRRVKGGWKNPNTTTKKPLTKKKAQAQHRAIKANQARKRKKGR